MVVFTEGLETNIGEYMIEGRFLPPEVEEEMIQEVLQTLDSRYRKSNYEIFEKSMYRSVSDFYRVELHIGYFLNSLTDSDFQSELGLFDFPKELRASLSRTVHFVDYSKKGDGGRYANMFQFEDEEDRLHIQFLDGNESGYPTQTPEERMKFMRNEHFQRLNYSWIPRDIFDRVIINS